MPPVTRPWHPIHGAQDVFFATPGVMSSVAILISEKINLLVDIDILCVLQLLPIYLGHLSAFNNRLSDGGRLQESWPLPRVKSAQITAFFGAKAH
jgi:hypothetical protein